MENLRHDQDLTDSSRSASSNSSSSSSFDSSTDNTVADSDSDNSTRWQDAVEWDLERVGQLRDILRIWVEGNIPADEIGDFLVSCLYNCDDHLDNRVTRMVDDHETYAHIARVLVEYFQIRDDDDKPLWTKMIPGDLYRRPGKCLGEEKNGYKAVGVDTVIKEGPSFYMTAPEPVHPVRWPLFLSDLKVHHFSPESMTDEESDYEPWIEDEDLARLGNAEHRVQIETPQNLTEATTAEMIIPTESDYLIQTDESQDDAPPFHMFDLASSPADVGPFHLSDLLGLPVEWNWV